MRLLSKKGINVIECFNTDDKNKLIKHFNNSYLADTNNNSFIPIYLNSSLYDNFEDFANSLEDQLRSSLFTCNNVIPVYIIDLFDQHIKHLEINKLYTKIDDRYPTVIITNIDFKNHIENDLYISDKTEIVLSFHLDEITIIKSKNTIKFTLEDTII